LLPLRLRAQLLVHWRRGIWGSRLYRDVADTSRITSTHWHVAWANGLGWGFDGMDGAILALVAPMLMNEFAINLGTYRSEGWKVVERSHVAECADEA
jgi:hypothetical protein